MALRNGDRKSRAPQRDCAASAVVRGRGHAANCRGHKTQTASNLIRLTSVLPFLTD